MFAKRFRPILALLAAALPFAAPGASLFQPAVASKAARTPGFIPAPVAVTVDLDAILEAGLGGSLEVALPDGTRDELVIDAVEAHANGDVTWRGHVRDAYRTDLSALGTTGTTGTYGEIQTAHGAWGVIPSQAGHDWLFDKSLAEAALPARDPVDDALVPPGLAPALPTKATCAATPSMPSPVVTIDVLAVTTPDFVSVHGGAAGAETRLNNLFASMNAYFQASNVAIQYRRVGTVSSTYQAASTANDDDAVALDAVTTGKGSFANVAALRDYFGADMVALFRGPKSTSGNSISGISWLNGDTAGNLQPGVATHMYSVSGDWNFPSATLAAHELGHNLGNAHDRPNAGSGGGLAPYSFGHYVCGAGAVGCGSSGFPDMGTGFGTIMAYEQPTVAKFSSPSLTCQSSRAGALAAPCGVADQQDDVRSMNCVRQSAAAIRKSWVGGCDLAVDADHDGLPDCIEAGIGRSSAVKDNDVFGNNLLFVAQQYRDFLSREADADGLNFWMTALAIGSQTRATMADSYLNSGEFQGAIAPVARLYFAYFLRVPDYAGLTYWISQFKAGVSLRQVSQQFAQSAEFVSRYGSLGDTQFVTLVYNNVLGRAPDAAGLAYWTGQLGSGAIDRGGMMAQFSESAEYLALAKNKVYVTMMYAGMLRRAPDPSGFDYWVGALNGGQSGLALASSFVAAAEYRNRFLP